MRVISSPHFPASILKYVTPRAFVSGRCPLSCRD
jgi:hypothetical protein